MRDNKYPLKYISVIVDLNEDAINGGLSKELLKTDVELKLRLAGINIKSGGMVDQGYLYVNIICKDTDSFYDYCYKLEFRQPVYLSRNLKFSYGATWDKNDIYLILTG